jgi:hypothetical protein
MKDTMLAQYRAELDRRLDRLLSSVSQSTVLQRRDRYDLFHFVTRHDVPYTNNACERALRRSVILRNVTNRFRAEWGAKVYAAAASAIATGRVHGPRQSYMAAILIAPQQYMARILYKKTTSLRLFGLLIAARPRLSPNNPANAGAEPTDGRH